MDLFDFMREQNKDKDSPLAARMRPTTLDEVVGQQHIIGKDKLLYRAIKADKLSSIIFYGPPGTGKTTLAKVIANTTSAEFTQLIANSVNVPILLYNIPGRTGVTMAPDTIIKLCSDVKNIVGVKEASGNISAIAKLMSKADGKVDLYSGNDDQIVPILSLGGKGVISVLSNVAPKQTHDICENYFNGNVAESCRMQLEAIELIDALFCEVNPIPVKKAMNLLGKCTDGIRRPLTVMEDANVEKLRNAMMNYGILSQNNDSESSLNARLAREASESNIR